MRGDTDVLFRVMHATVGGGGGDWTAFTVRLQQYNNYLSEFQTIVMLKESIISIILSCQISHAYEDSQPDSK